MGLVVSHCLWAFRLGPPNHLVPTPFQGVTQPVHTCHFLNAPDYLVFSGEESFRHR